MISGGEFGVLLDSWKIIAIFLLLILSYFGVNVLYISARKKVSPHLLLKKMWKTMLVALTTASSAAVYETNSRCLHQKFGIDKRLVDFGIPLGYVLFSPADIAILLAVELGFAEMYGIAITLQFLVVALITNLLLSFAIPPVPGGSVMGYTIALAQLGIPLEDVGIALVLDAIIDFPATACNVSGWQLTMIDVADSLDMLDNETLYK